MCDLAGEWVPTRQDEWYNNNPGKHRLRARVPYTKVTYDTDGKGNGWVGELNVNIEVSSIAPGKYTASCRFGLWYAGDGNLTILDDGVLQVRYPSNGIVEYWQRVDGQGATNLAKAQSKWKAATKVRGKASERALTLALRACLEVANEEYVWHWALAVNDEVYEVAAWMGIMGPRGIVASNALVVPYNTALGQFHGYLPLDLKTRKSDVEICKFIEDWVSTHPKYNALGPNCQTFSEDLYTFCTGHNLPFAKFADLLSLNRGAGPESHWRTVWNNPEYKPVSTDNSLVAETACKKAAVKASLGDRAQVLWSQSVSSVRSHIDRLSHSRVEPTANRPDTYVDADWANFSVEPVAEEAASFHMMSDRASGMGALWGGSPRLTLESNEEPEVSAATVEDADGQLEHLALEAAAVLHHDLSCISPAATDASVLTGNASVTEADCQQGDVDASLADRAQVCVSQSVSAVRARMDGLTQSRVEPTANQPDTYVHADAANSSRECLPQHSSHVASLTAMDSSQEEAQQALEGVCAHIEAEMGYLLPVNRTTARSSTSATASAEDDAAVTPTGDDDEAAVESTATAAALVDTVQEGEESLDDASIEGSIEASVASPMDSATTPEWQSEQAHMNATHLDQAQVFVSLAVSALRSQVPLLVRPNSVETA